MFNNKHIHSESMYTKDTTFRPEFDYIMSYIYSNEKQFNQIIEYKNLLLISLTLT